MAERRRRSEPNAGAFMGPDVMIPTPMGKLGDSPARPEPANDDDLPPRRVSVVDRFAERIRRLVAR